MIQLEWLEFALLFKISMRVNGGKRGQIHRQDSKNEKMLLEAQ